MLANRNVFKFLHCKNALEIIDSIFISGLFDNMYVNKFSHVSQYGIFRGDNVILVIPDGNYIIRREENLSAIQCLLLLVQVGQTINEPGSKIL